MADDAVVKSIRERLFFDPETSVYALLDGASVKELLDKLYGEEPPEYACLYSGELEPDMAEVAPYLARLDPEAGFAEWVLAEGWGNHWGVFVVSNDDLLAMRRHFRRFTKVLDPDGKYLYFRFYDPRVLRVFLPTCMPDELDEFFGSVLYFALEDEDPARMLRYSFKEGKLRREEIKLGEK